MNKKLEDSAINSLLYVRPNDYWRFGFSKSHFLSLIKEKKIPSFTPSPKLRIIAVRDIIAYIEKETREDLK